MSGPLDSLSRVAQLAALMREQAAEVERAEARLRQAKEDFRRTEQEDLPALMSEIGISEIKLPDGTKIEIVPDVQCGISEANRAAAADWLRANGFAGLLKTELVLSFGRGEAQAAIDAAERIHDLTGLQPAFTETVHPQTLKSFVKEQREKGATLPEAISVHPFDRAKLKAPKA